MSRSNQHRLCRLICSAAMLTACGPGPEESLPALFPVRAEWTAVPSVAAVGEVVELELALDWGTIDPSSQTLHLSYEDYGINDETFSWRDSEGGILSVTAARHGWLWIQGDLTSCGSPDQCITQPLPEVFIRVAGGEAMAVTVPAPVVNLVVGEQRPMQATPIAARVPEDRLGSLNDLTVSHEPVTYGSDDPSVVTVDDQGLLVAVSEGSTLVHARVGSFGAPMRVEVAAGELGPPPEGAWLVSATRSPPTPSDNSRDGLNPGGVALEPSGAPLVISLADPSLFQEQHTTSQKPAYLLRWTGSGFGYERLNAWHEVARSPVVTAAPSGHLTLGWRADSGTGLTVLDRPASVAVGGWQRRRLPMRLDLDEPSEPETSPVYGDRAEVLLAASPGAEADTTWVAYAYPVFLGRNEPFPAGVTSRCMRVVRLARVTPEAVEVQDALRIADPYNAFSETDPCPSPPTWTGLALGAPEGPDNTPSILVLQDQANTNRGGMARWLRPTSDGFVEAQVSGPDGVAGVALSWSAAIDVEPEPFMSGLVRETMDGWAFAATGVGGGRWQGIRFAELATATGFGFSNPDSLLGPVHNQRNDIDDWGNHGFFGVGSGYGRVAMHTSRPPPDVSPVALGMPEPSWIYLTDLPETAEVTSEEDQGLVLTDLPEAPEVRPGQALVLDDGTRAIVQSLPCCEAQFVSHASAGVGASFGEAVRPSNTGKGLYWTDGEDFWHLRVGIPASDPATLVRSSDGLAFTTVGSVALEGDFLRVRSSAPGVHWVLTTSPERHLYRLEVVGSELNVRTYDVGVWPGWSTYVGDPALVTENGEVWFTGAMGTVNGGRGWLTRRYDAAGDEVSASLLETTDNPNQRLAAAVDGALLYLAVTPGAQRYGQTWRSVDDGASFQTQLIDGLLPDEAHGIGVFARLPDGRLAWVFSAATAPHRVEVVVRVSSDGATFGEPTVVRPWGGASQALQDVAVEPDGGLLLTLGDSGTITRWPMEVYGGSRRGVVLRVEPSLLAP